MLSVFYNAIVKRKYVMLLYKTSIIINDGNKWFLSSIILYYTRNCLQIYFMVGLYKGKGALHPKLDLNERKARF